MDACAQNMTVDGLAHGDLQFDPSNLRNGHGQTGAI